MAWYDISDMPWLARDPIERVTEAGVRGAQVGSMMAQTRQRDRQLNLQEKELQQRQAADALRAKVQQQQLTLNSLNIDSAIRERDDLVGNQAALSVLSSYVGGQLKSANPDYQLMRAGALDIMAINPKLFRDKRAMDLLDQVKTAEELKNEAMRIRAMPGYGTVTPGITQLTDSSGNPIDVLQTGPNRFSQVRTPTVAGSSDTATTKDIVKANEWLKKATELEAAGDVAGAKALRDDALFLKDTHAKSGMVWESDGAGGFRFTMGGGTPKTPMAVTTKVLERLSQTEKAIDNLDDLAKTLRPEDVGFKGVLGELVLDKILPQLGTATADVKRMDNRTKLRTLAENLMRQVSADSRFSNADRISIGKILPSAGVVESFEHTQQTIKTLRKVFAKRALIDAKEAGQAPAPFAVRTLDDVGLQEAVQADLLTREQGAAEFFKRHPELTPIP